MKKGILNKAVSIFLGFVLLLFLFKPYIMPVFWGFMFKSPAIFEDIRVSFPKGIILSRGEDNISFHLWDNPHVFLFIKKMNQNDLQKKNLLAFLKKKNCHILTTQDQLFKGYEGFSVSYVDDSWEYNKAICVISKGLYLGYKGTKRNFEPFKDIIHSIEFL